MTLFVTRVFLAAAFVTLLVAWMLAMVVLDIAINPPPHPEIGGPHRAT